MHMDEVIKQLHDQATRGITLSASDQAQLDAWYAAQDQVESVVLTATTLPHTLAVLQTRVDAVLTQLVTVTHRIQGLTAQNDSLRREITLLQQQLAQTPVPETR